MKFTFRLVLLLLGFSSSLTAQIKIGDNPQNIDPVSVLELESTERVLVITRVTTVQMNAIVPSRGAMVYNIDASCIFYFDGSNWVNLCGGQGIEITSDAIVNPYPSIEITASGNQRNVEVLEIQGDLVTDGTLTGLDIQDGSINSAQLANNAVGAAEIQDVSIGDAEIDFSQITLSDFINDAGYITAVNVVSADAGNDITLGTDSGAYFNAEALEIAIQTNADAIADDTDGDPTNELQTISSPDASVTVNQVGNDYELTVAGGGTDNQNIQGSLLTGETLTIGIEDGLSENVDLSIFALDTDVTAAIAASEALDLDMDPTNEVQDLASVLAQGTDAGASLISNVLDPVAAQDVATKAYVDATSGGGPIVSADTPNSIVAGSDGGALYDDPDADATNEIQDLAAVLTEGSDAGASLISNVLDPVAAQDVATKAYVDATSGGGPIVSADTPNSIIAGSDGGALYDDPDADATNEIQDLAAVLTEGSDAGASLITNVLDPVAAQDVATKAYVDANAGVHFGTAGSIFFADDITGAPAENNSGFYWDAAFGGSTGALRIGIDGNTPSTRAKVHIMEDLDLSLSYPLQIQNNSALDTGGAGVGLLFSVEGLGSFGKGALVYERLATFGRGDFHFLQEPTATSTNPEFVNAVMTIKNSGAVGVGTTTPGSTLEVNGSFATNLRTTGAGAVNADDHTVIFTSVVGVTLPDPTTCAGRMIILKNTTGVALTVSPSYVDNSGITSNTIAPGVTWLQSDGVVWQQIN